MRTAQVATAALVAILTFSALHAAFGHRWYGWHHHRYDYDRYDRCDGYEHPHRHWQDRDIRQEQDSPDSTYKLQ